jgi:asparagine synthetase B (glutamine-hydrolysing)
MSGVAGWIDFQRDLTAWGEVVHAMTATMRHRGPDGKGVWLSRTAAIGHRELVTTKSASGERLTSLETSGGTVCLAYDGEIYNLPELRQELGAGESESLLANSPMPLVDPSAAAAR